MKPSTSSTHVKTILLVEDNPGDIRLIREALKEEGASPSLAVVNDGEAALAFLHRHPPYENALRPDLILLDLQLPRKNGHEVLAEVKADERLRIIPVVVLTSSEAEGDIFRAYTHQANSYITKPIDLQQFFRTLQSIYAYWFSVAQTPPGDSHE
ncbi:MAG: response regulator [Anaerolineales bacterium]